MKMLLKDIALAVQGELLGENLSIDGISIDTRTLVAGNLYIAIKGNHFDGHEFIETAKLAKAGGVLVEHISETDLPQIIVKDSRLALAELAGFWRKQQKAKIVGVTGSNGKTTVKEMIASILSTKGKTLYTQGNLNNNIGVPLTLLKLQESNQYAVIEMGANHPGEIAFSSQYAKPDVSVITNIGQAHIEGFGDMPGIAKTKAEILESLGDDGVAILNRDDEYYAFFKEIAGNRKLISFGLNAEADVSALRIKTVLNNQGFETNFELKVKNLSIPIKLQLAGEHNVKNALAAAAVAMQFEFEPADIKTGLEQVKAVTGRMQLLRGHKGNIVIDDTYNANPSSLQVALDILDDKNNNWLVLGAFGELGEDSREIHQNMGKLIKSKPVQRLFATGELAKQTVEAFGNGGLYFENQDQLIIALNQAITGSETLLIKGSRSQKMENVVAAIVENFRAAK
jgi:UDP-N-acetylmuramoyl-tripeptide--D-alanyl-D-alanine ligase